MKSVFSSVFVGLFAISSFSSAANKQSEHFHIPTTDQKFKIDAVLDEDAWKQAHKIDINNVTRPEENVPSPVKTEAYIIEDGRTLYIAFKAFDPNPENIRAVLSDRDSSWGDDRVGIKIDTYNDQTLAYQFFINPLGTQTDVIENEVTKNESASWDVIWDSAGKITDEGYIVEVAIPLRTLNFNDSLDVQNWAMEFVRFYPREKELRISNTTIDHDNACWICQMVPVSGLKGAKQGKNFTAVPTFVSGYSESRDVSSNAGWDSSTNSDVGLDLKWGITPDVTLNGTLNPDFSQVEADAGQLNVNNTFALFLPEKRSFFLANKDYFDTPVNLIYTRNINDPDYGAKISGKVNQHSFGAFAANDTTTSFLLPGNLSSDLYTLEEESSNAAMRYRYAISNNFSAGGSMTVRESDSYSNYVTSIDSKYRHSKNDTFNFQFMNSTTDMADELISDIKDSTGNEQALRIDDVNGSDQAYRIDYRHQSRDVFFKASHHHFGKNFKADLAFINNVDQSKSVIGGGKTWRSFDNTWWTEIEVEGDWDQTVNEEGEQLEQELEAFLNIRGQNSLFLRQGIVVRERVADRIDDNVLTLKNNVLTFDEKEIRVWHEYKPMPNIWVGNFFKVGENVDFANSQLADSFALEPRININWGQHFSSKFTYKYNRLDKGSDNLYIAKLIDFRMTYQFSIRSFIRLTMVHYDIERALENYNEDVRDDYSSTYKSLSTQLLYSYKINPQTLFFAGYSDGGYQDDELTSIKKDNRNVFLKLSYAWLM